MWYSSKQMSAPLTSNPEPEANLGYLFRLAYQRFRAALDDALQDLGAVGAGVRDPQRVRDPVRALHL